MKNYYDNFTIFSVLGNIIKNPALLEKFPIELDDLGAPIYQTIFKATNNLYAHGVEEITPLQIDSFLSEFPKQYEIWNQNDGLQIVSSAIAKVNESSFEFYYENMKKRSLLQTLSQVIDLTWLYDCDSIDPNRREAQTLWLNETSIAEIMSEVDSRIEQMRSQHFTAANNEAQLIGEGALELIDQLQTEPAIGAPFAMGGEFNALTRGLLPGKFYLRSAISGGGKSRSMIADLCWNACSEYYDTQKNEWIKTGAKIPCSLITTELMLDEVQTMALAFLSGVQEKHILLGKYLPGELDRVVYAANLLSEAKLFVTELPEYDVDDLEMVIRRSIKEHGCQILLHDYIHSSVKLMESIGKKARGMALREDQLLYTISVKLKEFANRYQIAILSSTQLNGSAKDEKEVSANMLAGAKSIIQKADLGAIMLKLREDELKSLQSILATGVPIPDGSITIYKNRRGKQARIWYQADLGTCRFTPLFATNNEFELMDVEKMDIYVKEDDEESLVSDDGQLEVSNESDFGTLDVVF